VDTAPYRESEPQKRRSIRIAQAVPLTVVGVDALGRPFQERTSTLIINCHGCRYHSKHYVLKNMWVTFEVPHPEPGYEPRNFRGRVTWIQRPRTVRELFQIAVELENPGNVWGIAFPPPDWFAIDETPRAEIPAPAQATEEDWSVPTIDKPSPPADLPLEEGQAPPEGEARAEGEAEDNVRVMPAPNGVDPSVLLARQMSRLLNEARQQLQEAVRENSTRAVAAETRPLMVALQNQLRSAAEKSVHEVISAQQEELLHDSLEQIEEAKEAELQSLAAQWAEDAEHRLRQATERLRAEFEKLEEAHQAGLDERVREKLEQALAEIQRASAAFAVEIQTAEARLEESRHLAQASVSVEIRRWQDTAESALTDARTRMVNLERATSELQERMASATQEAQAGWRGRIEADLASAGVRLDQRIESSIENAARVAADRMAQRSESAAREAEQKVTQRIEEVGRKAAQAAGEAEASLARLRDALETESSRAEKAIGEMREAAGHAEDHAAALEALRNASAEELERRGEALVEANSAEMNRRAEGAVNTMASRLEFALETAAQQLLQRLAKELEERLSPELDRVRGAIEELQANSEAFEDSLLTHQDRLREAAEISLREAIGHAKEGLQSLRDEFERMVRESQAKWLAELESKAADTTHATFESMFKTADWYEKKVQTQMQASMDKGLEQATEALRTKAGEISGVFATELDHYSRNYVAHSKEQMEELIREAAERVREQAQQAANGVAAGFSERAEQIATEQQADFTAKVRAEADRTAAQIHADAAESAAKAEAAQRDAESRFRAGLEQQTRESVASARAELDSQAATLAESWKAARATQQELGRQDLARLGETAIEAYKQRLENASNSWLLAAVASLAQQSSELIERLAKTAEERVRTSCSSVFTEIGEALRQRLLGPSAEPKPHEQS